MTPAELDGVLAFLRQAERLKTTSQSAHTSAGQVESVAEHSWRVGLMALVLRPAFPDVDLGRLLAICLVHDLGEAIGGDIPAPEQARRLATEPGGKGAQERRDLETLVATLPLDVRNTVLSLWDEYENATSPEARLAKALDKLETILQHTQGDNPTGFDYRFNLGYGRQYTAGNPILEALRSTLDQETERRAREAEGRAD